MRPQTFWYVIKNSFTSPQYYLQIFKSKLSFNLRFFLISMILLGLTLSLKVNQKILPTYQSKINDGLNETLAHYPQDLEIKWLENQLELSPAETLMIPYPSNVETKDRPTPVLAYLVPDAITADELSTQLNQESLLVISSEKIFINTLQNNWAETALIDFLPEEEIVLNQTTFPSLLSQFKDQFLTTYQVIKKTNFFIIPLGLLLIKFWAALVEGLLIFLFFKLSRLKISFIKTLQLSLHLVVTAEIINQIAGWIYPQIQVPLFNLSYWMIFSYIFWTQKNKFSKI